MTPWWFIAALLTLNLLACAAFLVRGVWPWALIYGGAAMIQAGCWWLVRTR